MRNDSYCKCPALLLVVDGIDVSFPFALYMSLWSRWEPIHPFFPPPLFSYLYSLPAQNEEIVTSTLLNRL